MSRRVEALLEAARQVEVGEPPPLTAIRSEAGVRARRSAYLAAFALALPLGAAAAAGGWAFKQRMESPVHSVEKQVRPRVEVPHGVAPVAADGARRPDEGPRGAVDTAPADFRRAAVRATAVVPPSEPPRVGAPAGADAPTGRTPRVAAQATTDVPPSEASRAEAPPTERSRHAHAADDDVAPGEPRHDAMNGAEMPAGEAVRAASQPLPLLSALRENAATEAAAGKMGYSGPPSGPQQPQLLEAPARTGLSDEAAQLTVLVSTLRQQHDPAGTLALVAQYRAKFPSGALGTEVTLVAAEAHRALGQSAEALSELEKVSVDARGGELTVLRAELRAELGHCAEALTEVDAVRGRLPQTLRERAERVEASCR
jgi:hypothetical protein